MESRPMVVCRVYKLFKDGENFTKEGKKVKRNRCVIPRGYVEEKNAKWEQNGLWHEINEEATKEYYVEGDKKVAKRKEIKESQANLGTVLAEALKSGANPTKKATTKKEVAKEEVVVDSKLVELRIQYEEVTGKVLSPRFKNDAEWMEKKIKESNPE